VIRGISSGLPLWAAEFTKFTTEFFKIFCGKLWALIIMSTLKYLRILISGCLGTLNAMNLVWLFWSSFSASLHITCSIAVLNQSVSILYANCFYTCQFWGSEGRYMLHWSMLHWSMDGLQQRSWNRAIKSRICDFLMKDMGQGWCQEFIEANWRRKLEIRSSWTGVRGMSIWVYEGWVYECMRDGCMRDG